MGLNEKFFKSASGGGVPVGTDNFMPVVYSGNGTSSNSITTVGFQPDMMILKNRTISGENGALVDVLRNNMGNILYPNLTNAEADFGSFPAFTGISNGFNIGSTNLNISGTNNYIAWCWYAPTSETNTNGTITSTIKKNIDAGFSIVKGSLPTNGATNGDTFGHGLSSAPELIIYKSTSITLNWYIFSEYGGSLLGNNNVLKFTTDAATSDSLFDITSTTFKVGSTNTAHDFAAYCFHSVAGYQKIGSYTGNGNVSGPTETLDFEPRFLMIKSTDGLESWIIYDSSRNTSNPRTCHLRADKSDKDYCSATDAVNFNSNNFQIISTWDGLNKLNDNYIYLAIA